MLRTKSYKSSTRMNGRVGRSDNQHHEVNSVLVRHKHWKKQKTHGFRLLSQAPGTAADHDCSNVHEAFPELSARFVGHAEIYHSFLNWCL